MELVSMAKEVLQNAAEHAASYRLGQTVLRYFDRTLWVVEKCARWAVPPPLDQDERPQPELVRPLPWIFFLMMLIVLRVTRESVSLAFLIMGKPPLRSADVVMYIQSKRRYLRTLKYQGNRIMRARTSTAPPRDPWYGKLQSLFEFTMCFRRNSLNYGNNNTTSVSNNDEVLVIKRSKPGREDASTVASSSAETTMERLIEKMMIDLDADSDEDSGYTLTSATSPKSYGSEFTTASDQDTVFHNDSSTPKPNADAAEPKNDDINFSPIKNGTSSTPEKKVNPETREEQPNNKSVEDNTLGDSENAPKQESLNLNPETKQKQPNERTVEDNALASLEEPEPRTTKQEVLDFIQHEKTPQKNHRTPKNEKIANGRTVKSAPSKKKGSQTERRDTNVPVRIASANNSM